jgi:carbonic anhydrase
MLWSKSPAQGREGRSVRRPVVPACEALEGRVVLSAAVKSHLVDTLSGAAPIHQARASQAPVIGTITGQVTKETNNKGFRNVKIQLLDGNGNVVETVNTNSKGKYKLKVFQNGPYVVREVVPKGFSQTSPTFTFTPPTGALSPGFGNSSWAYSTGNSNPSNGPVGPYAWDTIAPAGTLPFESPINLTGPTTDLGQVLSIHYNNTVPTHIINNGHQFQVQFPPDNPADTVSVGGQVFNLAQFHYHDPSETTVNGQGFSMEEHFVNSNAAGAETVLAVFLQLGAHNNALDPILNAATANLSKPNSTTTITTPINFSQLLPSSMQGWFYQGSLTTPPLSQPVNWFVFSTPITLDSAQLKQYEAVASGSGFLTNNRPIQPTDGRQLNENNFDVNFQNQSVANLNFAVTPLLKTAKA